LGLYDIDDREINEWKRDTFGMILTGRTKVVGEIPVGIPFYPKRIPYGLAWDGTRTFGVRDWQLGTSVMVSIEMTKFNKQ